MTASMSALSPETRASRARSSNFTVPPGMWVLWGATLPGCPFCSTAANSSCGSMGFEMYPSIPASRHRSRSLCMAWAVIATIRVYLPVPRSRARIVVVASIPPMTGICRSISTTSNLSRSSQVRASPP